MKRICSNLFLALILGMLLGGLIWGPALVLGQASTGGPGTANTVYVPGLLTGSGGININSAYSLPTADGNNGDVLTTNGSGTVSFQPPGAASDVKAAIDSGATADYVGAASNDGFLRTSAPLTYGDGGDYVTLGISQANGSTDGYLSQTDWTTFNNKAGSGANSDITSMTGLTGDIGNPSSMTMATGGAIRTGTSDTNTALLQAYDVDGTSYTTFGTLTAGNTPTFNLSLATTVGGLPHGNILIPSSDQSLSAGSALTVSNPIMRVAGNGGAVTITATPSISAPTNDGTCIIVQGTSDTNTVKYQDEAQLANTDLALKNNQDFTLGQGDQLFLCYDSGDSMWYEGWRSDN